MDWLRGAFVVLVVVSLALGGATALEFGDRLGDVDTATDVDGEIEVSVIDAGVRGDRFVVTIQVRNPTDTPVVLQNAGLRVHNDSDERIVAGPGRRLDDGRSRLSAGGAVEATYELSLSAADRRRVESALRRDARLSMNVGMRYRSTEFDVVARGLDVTDPTADHGGDS